MTFNRYICWQTNQVYQILNPDAEYVDDEVFLAIHSEHPLWMIDLTDPRKRWQQDAQSFLEDFLAPNRKHVQVAVTGDSGSGKSHLIHWMKLNIPAREDRYVLSIPRSGTSLRGILDSIINVLPPERRRKYQERLEMAGYYTENRAQRRERLLDEIALAIHSNTPRDDSQDAETEAWLIENLPHLFHDPYYRQHYTPHETGIIAQMITHITEVSQEYHRITERRVFRRDDLPRSGVDVMKMSEVARNFYNPLLGMPEYLLDFAVGIINRNLDTAIGRMLNFTGDQLIQLMREVRQYLYEDGKTLILLIEDFARTQGIDGALLEALIEAGGTETNKLCEIRWAMAVTTGYYERLPNTVQTRMAFVIDMNLPVDGQEALIKHDDIVTFTARYLNAVRLGTAQLKAWQQNEKDLDQTIEVPSYCDNCQHRDVCHSTFGEQNGFGLYPFTSKAIVNMARHKDVIQEKFNPRRLIKDVLAEVLASHRTELTTGQFPSEMLRAKMLEPGQGLAPAEVDKLQRAAPNHYQRQRTVLELWGSLDQLIKLPESLYEAFDLPAPKLDRKDNGVDVQVKDKAQEDAKDKKKEEETTLPPPSLPKIDPKIEAVHQWVNGTRLSENVAGDLRRLIYDAVISYIDWDAIGLEKSYFTQRTGGPFRERFIVFRNQQTEARPGAVQFTIPSTQEKNDLTRSALALEGLLQFRNHRHWHFSDGERRLVDLSECLEEWSATLIKQFYSLPDGQNEWDPVPLAIELLTVGASLGGVFPISETDRGRQLNALFAEWPAEAPVYSTAWNKLYQEIRRQRDTLHKVIQARASGTKGGQTGGFLDALKLVSPLQNLQQSWTLTAVIPQADHLRDPYRQLVTLYQKVRIGLPLLVQEEYDHKTQGLQRIIDSLPLDTDQKAVGKVLRQVREKAIGLGLGVNPTTLSQFDAARSEFESVELSDTLAEVLRLSKVEADLKLLPHLANHTHLRTLQVTDTFLKAAETLLRDIERVVQREVNNLEKPGELSVSAVQQGIRNSLSELKDILTTFMEGADVN